MIDDWRYDDGKMHERQLCVTCFILDKHDIDRDIYEFCHYYVSNGLFGDKLPHDKEALQEKCAAFGGDIFKYVSEDLFKEYEKWKELTE